MRSLTVKLSLAFLIVSIAGAVVAALLVRNATQTDFQQVVQNRAQTDFVNTVTGYYQYYHTWQNVDLYLAQNAPGHPGGHFPPPFILVDQQSRVIVTEPYSPYHLNDTVPGSTLARGTPVTVDGQVVGTVLPNGTTPPLSPAETAFLDSTQRALISGAIAAFAVALAIGILFARSLTRPVRELTTALHAMAAGEMGQVVPIRSRDELGALSATFNQMSSDLALANQQRRQMTADIAHDLRTPVTVIAGYLEALRDGVLPPTPERFAVLYEEAQHLHRLIEDLRTLSLADAGELRLQRGAVAPAALLGRIAETYRHQAEQAEITLAVQADPALPDMMVDAERMVQVLGNLVSNALRYTPAGGSITLAARHGPSGTRLSVRDTGKGIRPDALPRIFDRFYRADRARAQSGSDSGLGLAIAKAVVEAHGGGIRVASPPGQGATFTITLPNEKNPSEI